MSPYTLEIPHPLLTLGVLRMKMITDSVKIALSPSKENTVLVHVRIEKNVWG